MNSKQGMGARALACIAVLGASLAGAAQAETAYVTDMLQLDLYATQDLSGSAIRKLRSGDAMEIIERKGRYANVRLEDGQVGWVKSLYLVNKEPARTRYNRLEKEKEGLESTVEALRAQLEKQQARVRELENGEGSGFREREAVESELAQLRSSKERLDVMLSNYDNSVPRNWVFGGMGLALILGMWLAWYWIDRRSRARHGGFRVY